MKIKTNNGSTLGFTLGELLVVIFVLAVLWAIMTPALAGNKASATRIACVNNLKNATAANKAWAIDHYELLPYQVTNDGTFAALGTGEVWPHFQILSNQLGSPKSLWCPEEKKRRPAISVAGLSADINLSYFLNLDARWSEPQSILMGDRHVTNRSRIQGGVLLVTTNDPGAYTLELHKGAGNIALADGSVQQVTSKRWRDSVLSSGIFTNHLAMP